MHVLPADFVTAQIDAIFEDIEVAAVKIGMLACGAIVEEVADRLAFYKPPFIVVDPVLASTSGTALCAPDTATAIVRNLFPLATLITPNFSEATRFTGKEFVPNRDGLRHAAKALQARGTKAVLVKGGHLPTPTSDDLFFDGESFRLFSTPRVQTRNTHGTGCTLSSAIAAYLARGYGLPEAIGAAKTYLNGALSTADALNAGHGPGPLNHFHEIWNR
jgi:hydroxymethylpyrimidine/phosphomethylpyrimidine kinase